MNNQKKAFQFCLISLCCLLCNVLKCQNIESPRFFHLNIQSFSPTQQLVTSQGNVVSADDDEPGFLVASKLLFPISLKGKTKLIGQLDYGRESIQGLHSAEAGQDKFLHFSRLGLSLIAKHKVNYKTSYFAVWKAKTGSEQLFSLAAQSFSFNTTHLVVKQPNLKTKVGLGVQIGYNQRFSILPVVKYEKEFGKNWKADIILPSQVLFYKKLDKQRQVYLGVKGSRASYLLNDTQPFNNPELFYRRLTANLMLGFERQLKGPLGFMIEGGANIPVRSGLFQLEKRWTEVHNYQEGVQPYIKAGIFLAIDK